MANLHASPHRRIIYRRLLVRRFELENHGAQAVVAAAYRHAAFVYPVAEVEERILPAVCEREDVLISPAGFA